MPHTPTGAQFSNPTDHKATGRSSGVPVIGGQPSASPKGPQRPAPSSSMLAAATAKYQRRIAAGAERRGAR